MLWSACVEHWGVPPGSGFQIDLFSAITHTDIVPTCLLCFRVHIPFLLIVALTVYQRHKIWAPVSVQEYHRPLEPLKDRALC